LWGAYFAVILMLEKAFLLRLLDKAPRFLQHVYAIFLIVVGFLIFSHTDLAAAWAGFTALFGIGTVGATTPTVSYRLLHLFPLLAIGAIGATPIPRRIFTWLSARTGNLAEPIGATLALLFSVAYLVDSTFSPFAYTQF
jgi:alginate O-acetyltransferase complex protein AlgI